MRTINFATTIRRVFASRNNAAAIVTGKRSSHKPCWQARHAYTACQGAMRFILRLVALVRRDRDLMPLSMSLGRLQPCSVASEHLLTQRLLTRRVCVGPVERS